MTEQFEDVSRWPVSRYFREVVASQPDGRVLLLSAKINWCAGIAAAISLLFFPVSPHLAWVHVVLFLGMPLLGFIWFLRDMPSPTLTNFEHIWRQPWQRQISFWWQFIPAFLPWLVLVNSYVR